MKDENKEFYTEDCEVEALDLHLEAVDELVEAIMLEALKHMTASEKLDAKKYRLSAKGKKAIAKYLKKVARAGYKVDKMRSKLMKKVAKFAKHESEELDESILDEEFEITEEIAEDICSVLEAEDIVLLDELLEDVISFFEACKEDDEDLEVDPETGEESEEDLEEGFKHMTATAKAKAKKYRMSAAGKKAIKKYLKKSSRAGYKVDKQRSKLMKKVGSFARHESEDLAAELGLSEEELNFFDAIVADAILAAQSILDSELTEEDLAILEAEEEREITIEVPFEEKAEIEAALGDCELVSADEETGIALVKGTKDCLEAMLAELGYEDEVEDLEVEEEESLEEAFHHMSAAKKLLAKKYRMSAAGKKAMKKYLKKSSRAGYKVDKQRSKLAKKVAAFRNEAIQESLDAQFAASPIFESLNEGESTEIKSIVFNAVSSLLDQSYEKIAEDVTSDYETYMNEEVMPEMINIFEEYTHEIVSNLNENVEEYIEYIAEELKNELFEKNLVVKSVRSSELEAFSESLIDLIQEKLHIIPEQEDILFKNRETIEELSNAVQEAKVENIKMKNRLEEAKREMYVLKNMPSNISELQKENLQNYVKDVLDEAESFEEFKSHFDKAVNEAVKKNEVESAPIVENKKEESSLGSLFESLERMGKI